MQFGALLLLGASAVEPETMGARLSEGGMLAIVGMSVVFFALILINLLLSALNKVQLRQQLMEERERRKAQPEIPAGMAVPQFPPDIEPEILAALTAAAVAVIGRPVKLKSVRVVTRDQNSAWAGKGRADIHTSHRLRKGTR